MGKLEDALQGMLDRFATADYMNQEEKPKTFGCHHNAETCRNCESMVTAWKAVQKARAALKDSAK